MTTTFNNMLGDIRLEMLIDRTDAISRLGGTLESLNDDAALYTFKAINAAAQEIVLLSGYLVKEAEERRAEAYDATQSDG